jgi:hypothetical protein
MSTTLFDQLTLLRQAQRIAHPGGIGEDMVHNVIAANALGDNILIASPGRKIAIFEILILNNSGAQTLILKDGQNTLVQLSNQAVGGGLFAGFSGSLEPHFRVTAGNSLILNLSVGALVDGFVKYKIL